MRLKQQLTLIILITILTLTGPVQAVTASQLADHDDSNATTKMRLPNEGRSDLQELIQRVDANVDEPSAEEPSSEPEVDEPETVEGPVEDSGVTEAESKEAETTDDQKVVVQAKAPRAITTNTNGDSTWTFDSDTGLLVFSTGTLAQRLDTNLTNAGVTPADVKSIQFESGVVAPTAVTYLFANLTQLSEFIDLNNFNTSSVTYMAYWFDQTSALSTPDLSTFVTSNVFSMDYMFQNSGVTNLDLSDWDVSKVTSFWSMFRRATSLITLNLTDWGVNRTASTVNMSSMFTGTTALANLTLTNFKTTNVTNMGFMFENSGVTNLDLSDWDVSKVTSFWSMFRRATSLITLNLTDWGVNRTASTVNMSSMFTGTTALANLTLTNFKTTNVTIMSHMFRESGVTSLDLSHWDVTKMTSFEYMFYEAKSLTTMDLTDWGVNRTASTVNMNKMFEGTTALANLTLTNFETTNVTDMSFMFASSGVTSLDLSHWDVTKVASFSYMFYGAKSLTTLNLTDWGVNRTAGTVTMQTMFSGTTALTNLTLTNFKTTNVTNMSNMFQSSGVTNLALQELKDWDVTKVTTFSSMFSGAKSLTTLDLTNWGVNRTASTVDMSSMFNGTTALTNLTLTNFKTTNVTNMSNMFYNSGMTSLNLSHWDVTKVTTFGSMFQVAKSLTTLDLTNWGVNRTASTVGKSLMFSGTTALTNLTLTNFKTTNVTIMNNMFDSSGVTSLDLSDWDVTKVTTFSSMFSDAPSLRTLNLSGWNTSGATVTTMFSGTNKLWKITLGENIKFIANPGFRSAPVAGTTIPGTSYKTTAASWQIVGTGTQFNPKGAMVTTTEMYADRTEPVTYVWANKAEPSTPTIDSVSNITFGTLGASDFFNGNSPLATNMATGSVALKDLDNITTYNVTVAQTSDWTTDGESAKIAKSNLKIKYGANDLATGASSFWSGTSATATKNIKFNHDDTKNFSIWLNPSAVIETALLGVQLESELTWTLSETP